MADILAIVDMVSSDNLSELSLILISILVNKIAASEMVTSCDLFNPFGELKRLHRLFAVDGAST